MCVGLRYSAVRSHAAGRVTSASTPIWKRHPEGTAEQLRDGFRARARSWYNVGWEPIESVLASGYQA